uniref:Glycerol-3-phosphate dehydrogenase NAD-dependent N-terminal domain-containing protein n=1 Tax=Romanomermis culicivorax TaxID=13658 RepID=A0A915HPC4_ROMCU
MKFLFRAVRKKLLWGCAIARIIGENVKIHTEDYDKLIKMWVLEEKIVVDGKERKLSDCINEDHENYKYLRGYKLPDNVIAITSLPDTVKDADVLLFVVPHQFINKTCMQIKGKVKPTAVGLSLIK